ncbi:hypothetical protein STTU_4495 [Streptomyces sp. Tu6071]|nr:hypothetical protein STTU_4495 [Streptomyces sp. Tu6071]
MKIENSVHLTRAPPPRTAPSLLYAHKGHIYAHNTSLSESLMSQPRITRAPLTGRL